MHPNIIIKKISAGYQITLPNEFRKENGLDVGSMVSISIEGYKLVIEPFQHKSEALRKLKSLFKKTPEEFKDFSEKEVSEMVAKEIKLSRK